MLTVWSAIYANYIPTAQLKYITFLLKYFIFDDLFYRFLFKTCKALLIKLVYIDKVN